MTTPMQVTFSQEARRGIVEGVNIIANAVKSTLGPKGRNVLIQQPYKNLHITKDGVTVAKSIYLSDPLQNLGVQVVKQAADKTGSMVGDGTTTSTVLTQELVNRSMNLIQGGSNPIDLTRGMNAALQLVISSLMEQSIPVQDHSKVRQIATISANNDPTIGSLVADAFEAATIDGVITVSESKTPESYIEKVQGFQFNRGYASPYFVTNHQKLTAEYEDALVYVYDKKLKHKDDIIPIMELAASVKKPLIVIADDIEPQPLQLMIMNRLQVNFPIIALKAPAHGDRRRKILEDIAIATGGTLISEVYGLTPKDVRLHHLGQVKKVITTRSDTTFIEGNADNQKLQDRLTEIQVEIDNASNDWEKTTNRERYAKLTNGVVVLHVGAYTELELNEKKDRIDDALHATRAAIQEGVVPGGGVALLNARLDAQKSMISSTYKEGYDLVIDSIESPAYCIIDNAGYDPLEVLPKWYEQNNSTIGYDFDNDKFVDYIDKGIIDPTKVVITALENAISTASSIIMTEVTINPEDIELNTNRSPVGSLDDI